MSLLNLTNDQKYFLEFYINNYNENLRQIDLLYLNNELIFQHISNITGINACLKSLIFSCFLASILATNIINVSFAKSEV